MEKIILGIDPGTMVMGYGLIKIKNNKVRLITLDELLLHKLPNQEMKLKKVFKIHYLTLLLNIFKLKQLKVMNILTTKNFV